ncbi:MAG: 2-hydroxyglutaryl-CoA dehydratase [Syntrophomonadaceae bacterium]|jgi:predicted CoA-substrate-specific enzyme activase|nr:2-hydroxyglutaryl-CoA dehydratase [Syntrophomonadaceae bacterium]
MIGIDLGSRNVKIVRFAAGKIIEKKIYDTIKFYRHYGKNVNNRLQLDWERLELPREDIVATGYGKMTIELEGAVQIPEIQAHSIGAVYQSKLADFTLLDIGGQDTKVIKIRKSRAVDFLTNDRCAASSGRYMENMAAVLGISLQELASYNQDPVELSSTCAIFGETEIIARIVEGYSLERLAAGVNYALYKRFSTMLNKLYSDIIIMSGGGSLNQALRDIIARETGCQVIELDEPLFNGALGCCVYNEA